MNNKILVEGLEIPNHFCFENPINGLLHWIYYGKIMPLGWNPYEELKNE